MRKILISGFFTLTSLFTFAVPAFAANLQFNPSSGTLNKGCSYDIKIDLDTEQVDTDGTDALINYPTNQFTTSTGKITKGTIYSDYPGTNVDSATGKITISGLAPFNQPFKGKGTLATVNFTVSDSAQGQAVLSFDFTLGKTTDSNVVQNGTVQDVLSSAPDATYTIGTGACSGSPSSSPAPSSAPSSAPGQIKTPVQGAPEATPIPLKSLSPGGKTPGILTPTLILGGAASLLICIGLLGAVLF